MIKYILKRLIQAIPVLFGITILSFFIMQLAPGDPMANFINPNLSSADLEQAREAMGLNESIISRYFIWLKEILNGNFGYTLIGHNAVSDLIIERLPATMILTFSAFVLSFVVGVPIGVLGAVKKNTKVDYSLTLFALFGVSIPSFFIGLLVIYVFSINFNLFPTGGMENIRSNATGILHYFDVLHHLILPAIVLSLPNIAVVSRFTRSTMLDVLKEDFIRTAKAKGLKKKIVVYKHALLNALLPVVTIFGLSIPFLFSGAYITEKIFNWPGMGSLGISAITTREYSLVMGLNLITAVLVLFGSLLSDILYAVIDPRIKH